MQVWRTTNSGVMPNVENNVYDKSCKDIYGNSNPLNLHIQWRNKDKNDFKPSIAVIKSITYQTRTRSKDKPNWGEWVDNEMNLNNINIISDSDGQGCLYHTIVNLGGYKDNVWEKAWDIRLLIIYRNNDIYLINPLPPPSIKLKGNEDFAKDIKDKTIAYYLLSGNLYVDYSLWSFFKLKNLDFYIGISPCSFLLNTSPKNAIKIENPNDLC